MYKNIYFCQISSAAPVVKVMGFKNKVRQIPNHTASIITSPAKYYI